MGGEGSRRQGRRGASGVRGGEEERRTVVEREGWTEGWREGPRGGKLEGE